MTPGDRPVEDAQIYARSAILNDPDVIAYLLRLRDLRDRCGRWGFEYQRELRGSALLEWFDPEGLDWRISVIRERIATGFWGRAITVGTKGAGYGRDRGAYRAMDPETIELAVADLVRRLTGRDHPALGPCGTELPSKVRQNRRRLRRLATS
jgi:hypothetical protein